MIMLDLRMMADAQMGRLNFPRIARVPEKD